MVKRFVRFLRDNKTFILSFVVMTVLGTLVDPSLLMAEVTVTPANTDTASEGSEGLSTQMNGQDGSVSNVQQSGAGADIIEPDLDENISNFRTQFFALDTIMRKVARLRMVRNYEVKHFSVDASRVSCLTTSSHTEDVSKKRVKLPIDSADANIFQQYSTIRVKGVKGYGADGATQTQNIDLMLYVVGVSVEDGLPIVIAVNGKKQNATDAECYVPTIPNGSSLYRMSNAGSESQLFCPPTNKTPVPSIVYLQKRMSNTKFTTYFKQVNRKVNWGENDIIEDALWEFRRESEASYLWGVKGKIFTRDSQTPNRGAEHVYFSGGIIPGIEKFYEYQKGAFKFFDLLGVTKMMFTGVNGSKEAFVGVGKDLLEDIMKVDITMIKDINVTSKKKWGIKFNCFESSFGTLNVVHLPILDDYGESDIAICLDLDMLVRYKLEEKNKSLDLSVNGEDATRNVTILTDAPALLGHSHLIIKPNDTESLSLQEGMRKVKSSDSLPSTGNGEGDIIHLTKDVAETETNDALKDGQLAIWNGVKWTLYKGEVYA